MRLGSEPRGIVAKGVARSYVKKGPHYIAEKAKHGDEMTFVDVEFVEMIDYEVDEIIEWDDLAALFQEQEWTPNSSGIFIKREYKEDLDDLWRITFSHMTEKHKKTNHNKIITVAESQVDDSEIVENEMKSLVEETIFREEIDSYSYSPKPEERSVVEKSDVSSSKGTYPRDARRKANALVRANYTCEISPDHKSFISKRTGEPYMETHHLIPLEYWESFDYSLDVEANIVCLCSNCHNEIHYGKYAHALIESLYKQRSIELSKAGIIVSEEQLFDIYDGQYIKMTE